LRASRGDHEDQPAPKVRGLPDNPCGKLTLDLLNRDALATIKLVQTLSHRGDELDLAGHIVQRGIVANALKQILNNLLVTHVGSVHCEIIFFKHLPLWDGRKNSQVRQHLTLAASRVNAAEIGVMLVRKHGMVAAQKFIWTATRDY
jgi:hypothetical protein